MLYRKASVTKLSEANVITDAVKAVRGEKDVINLILLANTAIEYTNHNITSKILKVLIKVFFVAL